MLSSSLAHSLASLFLSRPSSPPFPCLTWLLCPRGLSAGQHHVPAAGPGPSISLGCMGAFHRAVTLLSPCPQPTFPPPPPPPPGPLPALELASSLPWTWQSFGRVGGSVLSKASPDGVDEGAVWVRGGTGVSGAAGQQSHRPVMELFLLRAAIICTNTKPKQPPKPETRGWPIWGQLHPCAGGCSTRWS